MFARVPREFVFQRAASKLKGQRFTRRNEHQTPCACAWGACICVHVCICLLCTHVHVGLCERLCLSFVHMHLCSSHVSACVAVYVCVFASCVCLCSSHMCLRVGVACVFSANGAACPRLAPTASLLGSQEAHFTDEEAESPKGLSEKLRLRKGGLPGPSAERLPQHAEPRLRPFK